MDLSEQPTPPQQPAVPDLQDAQMTPQKPSPSAWEAAQYLRFEKERSQPFYDLVDLIQAKPNMAIIDLGCGTGNLTRQLHDTLAATSTLGVDLSETMLKKSSEHVTDGLSYRLGDIKDAAQFGKFDLVFSNASLQWVPNHEELFTQLAGIINAEGQLAVQMPANENHLSHKLVSQLATEEPFATALQGYVYKHATQTPEYYSELLYRLGFKERHVRVQIYEHLLKGPEDVVEWTKGTLLTPYRERLTPELYDQFLVTYKERFCAEVGEQRPYFYPFRRMLIWAQK